VNRDYLSVAERAAHRCEYCRAPEVVFNFPFEVEHITPPGAGGTDEDINKALACRSCNLHKSDRIEGFDAETQTNTRLYNPRQDRWSDHFRYEPTTAEIIGLTAIGRVTVASLQMNGAVQIAARQQWQRLGLIA
jgi:hypothetical protein